MSLNQDVWVTEPDQIVTVGMVKIFKVQHLGATVISSPVTTCYKDGNSYSAILSGSDSVSGDTITCQTITPAAGDKGSVLVINVQAVVDGNTETRKFRIYVLDAKEEQ